MNVKIPLAIVIILAAAMGYLMGTDSGRQRRDVILVRLRRSDDAGGVVEEVLTDAAEQGTDAVADAVG